MGHKPTITDVLDAIYEVRESAPKMLKSNTALLLIDVQQLASPDHLKHKAIEAGFSSADADDALADYTKRFDAAVGHCKQLLEQARTVGVPCVHVKIEALSGDARDTGAAHRRMGWCYPPGSPETQFLPAVAPVDGEIVVTKTVSGAFTATNLDSILRHMGIDWLIVAGFETDECIEATGRVALDLGYLTLFAENGCTAYEAHSHDSIMAKYASWNLTRSTEELCTMLGSL